MHKILIIGGGKIGETAAFLLNRSAKFKVTVADQNTTALKRLADDNIATVQLDVSDSKALEEVMQDKEIVLSACPFYLNIAIAEAAVKTGTHYFDFTEDVKATTHIRNLAEKADISFMPQCGLAPGYIGIAAHHLAKQFDTLDTVKLRVGALPQYPTNSLKYNLTWSTDGLINEYLHPCDAIIQGKRKTVTPMEGYEKFSLDGTEYEAFNTSGGLAYLAEILEGKVQNLDYKTARYPGHCKIMKILLHELKLGQKPDLLKEILESSLPASLQDVVLVFISASGIMNNRFVEKIFTKKVFNQIIDGKDFTAIQLTTAGSACALIDMHINGQLPQKGFIRQGDVDFDLYNKSEFVQFYDNSHLTK